MSSSDVHQHVYISKGNLSFGHVLFRLQKADAITDLSILFLDKNNVG